MSGSDSSDWPRKRLKRFNVPGHAHELTFSCAHGLAMLNQERTRMWLIDAIKKARQRWNFQVWAYVIMPEHAHLLVYPLSPTYKMEDISKAIKQSVSRRAVNYLHATSPQWLERLKVNWPSGRFEYRFWRQGGGYDRNVVEAATAWKMVEYIHLNPVRRGLVQRAVDWPWSSARWYHGCEGILLEIDSGIPESPSSDN